MGSAEIDVGLGDGGHADLVVGARQEGRKGGDKGHGATSSLAANGDAHQVLFRDEALHKAVREGILFGNKKPVVA